MEYPCKFSPSLQYCADKMHHTSLGRSDPCNQIFGLVWPDVCIAKHGMGNLHLLLLLLCILFICLLFVLKREAAWGQSECSFLEGI